MKSTTIELTESFRSFPSVAINGSEAAREREASNPVPLTEQRRREEHDRRDDRIVSIIFLGSDDKRRRRNGSEAVREREASNPVPLTEQRREEHDHRVDRIVSIVPSVAMISAEGVMTAKLSGNA